MSLIRRLASVESLLVVVPAVLSCGCGAITAALPIGEDFVLQTSIHEYVLLKNAESGIADGQSYAGWQYADGDGLLEHAGWRANWFQKTAGPGDPTPIANPGKTRAITEHRAKDYAVLAKIAEKRAAEGDMFSQHLIGGMYEAGLGVRRDFAKAAYWFQKAADQGHAEAQNELGNLYFKGNGVPTNRTKALEWWQKAADQGDADAQWNLALVYYNGSWVPKNIAKAVEWFQKSAAQGHPRSQALLGALYFDGVGVPKDRVLAYSWANLAAATGEGESQKLRRFIERSSSQQELAEAERLSSNWKNGQVLAREGRPASSSSSPSVAMPASLLKRGTGTIFLVSKTGHAITNQHVVQGCTELRIEGRDGVAKRVTEDVANDLALVQVPGEIKAASTITSDPTKLRQGEDVVVFGFPLNSVLSSRETLNKW